MLDVFVVDAGIYKLKNDGYEEISIDGFCHVMVAYITR